MSTSIIEFRAEFSDEAAARKVKSILDRALEFINNSSEEAALHHALKEFGETKGINFDSWWYPEIAGLNDNVITAEFAGSPSGTEEQDVITWIKLYGATKVSGKVDVDSGGDAFTIEF
ncbi:MAG: hypothetical protein OEZ58_08785 [Gammaproteobacteria bacterium]|nr:hypothetical protein [Gammaproteobacteria bacterium]MDH5729072.1 hypothetical protein [Gammaproteobacteria bacterium]